MKRSVRIAAALSVSVCVAAMSAVTPSARAATFTATTGAVFNNPLVEADKWKVPDHFIDLINAADTGSQINVAEYVFATRPVADALVAASARGIQVRVVVDHESATYDTNPGYDVLKAAFADFDSLTSTQRLTRSWLQTCSSGRACLAGAPTERNPIQHNKFLLLSSVAGQKVVVEASQNLTTTNMWNNAVTVVGDDQLYGHFFTYFNRLAHNEHNDDNVYDDFGGTGTTNSSKVWFFPRAVPASGNQNGNDTIGDILANVACSGARIRIGMRNLDDDRQRIATELVDCARAGATVEIVYSEMGTDFRDIIKQSSRITRYRMGDALPSVHSKYMTVDGTFSGTAGKWIFTGSHNYDRDSLRDNDESLLRLNNSGVFAQFQANFDAMKAVATPM